VVQKRGPLEGLVVQAGFWRDRPSLVTGATGLLGGWLTRALLDQGAEVVALIRDWVPQSELLLSCHLKRLKLVRGDVCDPQLVERVIGEYEVDTVFHLAAQTIVGIANRNPLSTFQSNIAGTWTVLEACRRAPLVQTIVLASSDKAYGAQPELPYSEEMPLAGRYPYDVSKACADLLAQSYAATYRLPVAITRCGNFYGGGDLNWNRLVPGTIRSILRGQRPVIRSDGGFVRDFFYVEDGAAACLLLAERLRKQTEFGGSAFNFSTETQVSVLELVKLILRQMDSTLDPVVLNEASNEIRHQYLSAARARRELNWKPSFSLEEGISRTIAWYREFLAQ